MGIIAVRGKSHPRAIRRQEMFRDGTLDPPAERLPDQCPRYGFARRILRQTVSECSVRGAAVVGRRLRGQDQTIASWAPARCTFLEPKIEFPAKVLPHGQPPDISRRRRSRTLARHLHFREGVGRPQPLGKPTRKVGPLAYSGRAVALPLTRTPMAGCSCRVGGPTFFLFTGLKSRGKAIFPDDP